MIRTYRSWFWLIACSASLALSGCAFPFQRGPVFDQVDLGEFPIDRAQLLAFAYHHYHPEGPADSVARSLIAAQNVMLRDPDNELANFYAARAAMWLIEYGGEEIKRGKLADQAYEWSEKLVAIAPNRGEYAFFAGAHMGYMVRESLRPSLIRLRKVHDYFKKALELNPEFDYGAPMRAMGTLLILSPPWPTGVGDMDEGIEQLENAVRMFPTHPANHLYLALAYKEDKRYEEALASLDHVLQFTQGKRWGIPGKAWRDQAKHKQGEIKKLLK